MKNRRTTRPIILFALALTLALSAPPAARAAEKLGISFPDEKALEGQTLELNGLGVRIAKILFIHAKVYVGALYLEKRSKDPAAILDSPGTKEVDLHFVRDVGRDKIAHAWKEDLETNCKPDCGGLAAAFKKIEDSMKDMKDGDTMSFLFLPKFLTIAVRGQEVAKLDLTSYPKLPRVVLMTWLGPNPPNEEVKSGMLGLEP